MDHVVVPEKLQTNSVDLCIFKFLSANFGLNHVIFFFIFFDPPKPPNLPEIVKYTPLILK